MKRITRNIGIIVIGCLLVGAAVILFFLNFEKVSEDVWVGYRGEARTNDYLAAERLLKKWNYKVTRIYSQSQLLNFNPPRQGLVFFLTDAIYFNKKDLEKFIPWVEAGGHLVVCIDSSLFTDDDEDLSTFSDYFNELVNTKIEYKEDDSLASDESAENFFFELAPSHFPLSVRLDRSINFIDQEESRSKRALWNIGNGENTYFLQYQRGWGRVSLLGSALFMDNHRIAEDDNAFFFWYLITQSLGGPGGGSRAKGLSQTANATGTNTVNTLPEVWFISDRIMPSLAELIWEKGWPILISLGILVLVIYWRVSQRFGPILESRYTIRRSLMEYLTASGRFLWRYKQGIQLVETVRLSVKRQLLKKYRFLNSLTEDEQLARLPALLNAGNSENFSEIDLQMVVKSFNRVQPPVKLSASRFFSIINFLERVRKVL